MSGIYISEVSMPNGEGSKLVLQVFPNGEVYDAHGLRLGIANWSKAVPVPDHGRLIDADALVTSLKDEKGSYIGYEAAVIGEAVEAAPVIIPADFAKDSNVPTKTADKGGEG